MEEPGSVKESWDSLSSTSSNLEVSFSQDDYASDETSATSASSSTAVTPMVPSLVNLPKPTVTSALKSILKKQSTGLCWSDAEVEAGYCSDNSECGSDDSVYGSEEDYDQPCFEKDDNNLYEMSPFDESSPKAPEFDTDGESVDGPVISFGPMVHFDTTVYYAEAPTSPYANGHGSSEMTFHEMMELARAEGNKPLAFGFGAQKANNVGDGNMYESGEYTRDDVDLDKRLFAAYLNGIRGNTDPQYQECLFDHANDLRSGRARNAFFQPESETGVYLDHALNHVIGIFRNLLSKDEFDELVALSDEKIDMEQYSHKETVEAYRIVLRDKVETFLTERLIHGSVEVEIHADELSFFAAGIVHALENWNDYVSDSE